MLIFFLFFSKTSTNTGRTLSVVTVVDIIAGDEESEAFLFDV